MNLLEFWDMINLLDMYWLAFAVFKILYEN